MPHFARCAFLVSLLFGAAAALTACDSDHGEDRELACMYDYSVYSISEYGSSFDEYTDNCITVESEQECRDWTESDNECSGGFCSDYTYTNVEIVEGSCESLVGDG